MNMEDGRTEEWKNGRTGRRENEKCKMKKTKKGRKRERERERRKGGDCEEKSCALRDGGDGVRHYKLSFFGMFEKERRKERK